MGQKLSLGEEQLFSLSMGVVSHPRENKSILFICGTGVLSVGQKLSLGEEQLFSLSVGPVSHPREKSSLHPK